MLHDESYSLLHICLLHSDYIRLSSREVDWISLQAALALSSFNKMSLKNLGQGEGSASQGWTSIILHFLPELLHVLCMIIELCENNMYKLPKDIKIIKKLIN